MKHKSSFLPYLLILIGILLPIYLMKTVPAPASSVSAAAVSQEALPANVKSGSATVPGRNGPISLEVQATADQIYSINITEHTETDGIGTIAIAELPKKILESQSLQVDAVSGATQTSDALLDGVREALSAGGIDPTPFTLAAAATKAPAKDWSIDCDIVIVGAGGAGMSAAIEAANAGKKAVILESLAMVGGNSIRSTGGINAAKTKYQDENEFGESAGVEKTLTAAAEKYADNETITALAAKVQEQWDAYQASPEGYFDSEELFALDTMIGGKGKNDPALVATLVENSADAIRWLEQIGAPMPSVSSFGGASVKRIHRPVNAEGKTISVGSYVVPILHENLEKLGVDILLETTAKKILTDADGHAVGIEAVGSSGEKVTVNAKAVVLATGGFGANFEMVTKYRPELAGFMSTNAPGALGQGLTMAEELGAATVDLDQIQIHPTVEANTASLITEGLRGDGAILLNAEGQRFIDEVGTRDVVSAAEIAQPGGYAWLIVDQAMADASNVIQGYIKHGFAVEGADYPALAAALELDPAALEESMNRWNEAVANKSDPDFNRTSFASPLSTAPYYAIKVMPGIHHTMGGLKINTEAAVLNESGTPIPGLFAAGEVTGGVHGANRLGGNAVADFTVFGRIAGQSAAAYTDAQ